MNEDRLLTEDEILAIPIRDKILKPMTEKEMREFRLRRELDVAKAQDAKSFQTGRQSVIKQLRQYEITDYPGYMPDVILVRFSMRKEEWQQLLEEATK